LSQPEKLGPYSIERRLARGGMGEVFLARDTRLGRSVAIKVLPGGADGAALVRFLREARATAALQHSNIAMLHDVGEDSGSSYIVMERIEGATLASILTDGPLQWKAAVRHAEQLASALAHAHSHGILHRDIKPGNIMISPGRGAVLLDFGLAAGLPAAGPVAEPLDPPDSPGAPLTRDGLVMGTSAYMSPEQLEGQPLDGRSDLFQLGVTLYEALSGSNPFRGPTTVDTTYAILRSSPRPLIEVAPVPEALGGIVGRLLEKDRSRRTPDASALLAQLQSLERTSAPVLVPDEPTEVDRPAPRVRARALGWWAAAALGVAAATLAVSSRWGRPVGPVGPPSRLVPFTSGSGDDLYPAFSPDGASLAFTSNRGGAWDLWVGLVAGGEPVRVTDTPEVESQPAWSPDGARLAFLRGPLQGTGADILVMPALGGPTRLVTGGALDPAWSPDGEWIAYADVSQGWARIARIAANGAGEAVAVTRLEAGWFHRGPSWSPDGESIVFNRSPGGQSGQLMIAPADGGAEPRALTRDPEGTANMGASFTPDGKAVLYSSDRGGAMNLWRIGLGGAAPVRLTSGPGQDLSLALSADGRLVAFVVSPVSTRVLARDPATGASDLIATLDDADGWAPDFSVPGGRVALSRKVPGQPWALALVDPDGTLRSVLDGLPDSFWPRFHPDGKTLVFFTRPASGGRLARVGLDGTGLTWLTGEDESVTYPDVSPDGQRLAFVRSSGTSESVVVRPIGGGPQDERVVVSGATLPRFSPDGTRLTFARSRSWAGGVGVAPVAGGEPRWLTETGSWPTWMPGGREVAFADAGDRGDQRAWRIPASGGERLPLGDFRWRGSHFPFVVTPEGRLVTTDAGEGRSKIWLAEFGS